MKASRLGFGVSSTNSLLAVTDTPPTGLRFHHTKALALEVALRIAAAPGRPTINSPKTRSEPTGLTAGQKIAVENATTPLLAVGLVLRP